MMQTNYYNEVQGIINELGPNIKNTSEKTIKLIYERFLKVAINVTNNYNYDDLVPYVKEATISAIIRRGTEGMTGRSEGGISSNFVDITEKMKKDLISAGLRRIK